jgi:energy-converting hydrogenase Eha subunit C
MIRVLFPLSILVLAVAYGLAAIGFSRMGLQEGFGPGFFPSAIAAIVALLALWEMLVRVGDYRRQTAKAGEGSHRLDHPQPPLSFGDLTSAGIVSVAVVATVVAIPVVGRVGAGTAMVFALSIVMGTRPLWKGFLIALITTGAIYLAFAKGFKVIFAF